MTKPATLNLKHKAKLQHPQGLRIGNPLAQATLCFPGTHRLRHAGTAEAPQDGDRGREVRTDKTDWVVARHLSAQN